MPMVHSTCDIIFPRLSSSPHQWTLQAEFRDVFILMNDQASTRSPQTESMDAIDQFAEEVLRFEEWAHTERREPGPAAREALVRISTLYLAALQLPSPFTNELGEQANVDRVSSEDLSRVRAYLGVPIEMYGKVFDPLIVPPDESTIGSIADDIIDIYRDVVTGLRAYHAGNKLGALWEWAFGFQHHWGTHATDAMRAIHAWLAANDFDQFSNVSLR